MLCGMPLCKPQIRLVGQLWQSMWDQTKPDLHASEYSYPVCTLRMSFTWARLTVSLDWVRCCILHVSREHHMTLQLALCNKHEYTWVGLSQSSFVSLGLGVEYIPKCTPFVKSILFIGTLFTLYFDANVCSSNGVNVVCIWYESAKPVDRRMARFQVCTIGTEQNSFRIIWMHFSLMPTVFPCGSGST